MDRKLKYIQKLFANENKKLQEIATKTAAVTDNIQISPEDGRLLQILVRLGNIKNIVEIGTLGGYSTYWLSQALPKDGHIYTIERDDNRFYLAQENLKNIDNIEIIHGNAKEVLLDLEEKSPFDMIFIDADKRQYLDYLDWAESHIKKGGLVVADNTLLSGAVYLDEGEELPHRVRQSTAEIMKKFNLRIANKNKYTSIMLPTNDGLTIAIKIF